MLLFLALFLIFNLSLISLSVRFCDFADKLNLYNRDYHLEAFNNLTAPGEDPTKSNCFQLLSLHLENPSAPLNLLNSLFSLHPELDYLITMLPRCIYLHEQWIPFTRSYSCACPLLAPLLTRVCPRLGQEPAEELYLVHKASLRQGVLVEPASYTHLPGIRSLAAQVD